MFTLKEREIAWTQNLYCLRISSIRPIWRERVTIFWKVFFYAQSKLYQGEEEKRDFVAPKDKRIIFTCPVILCCIFCTYMFFLLVNLTFPLSVCLHIDICHLVNSKLLHALVFRVYIDLLNWVATLKIFYLFFIPWTHFGVRVSSVLSFPAYTLTQHISELFPPS